MKRLFALLVVLSLLTVFTLPASAVFDFNVDYMERMLDAVQRGDRAAGKAAQACRDEKIVALELRWPSVDYEDLSLLARLIAAEAGSYWLDEEWKMAVGEVVLNRVASPEFPNTIAGVLRQEGQYAVSVDDVLPDYASAVAAMKLLSGERVLNNPAVVFQANSRLGSGVYLELRDAKLGNTYLCLAYNMHLYD